MATYTWIGGSGAFSDTSRWSPSGVPISGDTALFNGSAPPGAGGGAISGSGAVDTIAFSFVAWVVLGQLSSSNASVSNGGTLALDGSGAQLVATNSLSVSNSTINLSNSGLLSATSGASASFGNAALNVSSRATASFNGAVRFGAGGATGATVSAGVLTVGGVFSLGTTGGGVGNLTLTAGAQVVVNAARDDTTTYLQLGAVGGSASTVRVDGSGTVLLLSSNSGGIGVAGSGELDVTGGGFARFNSGNNARNPALVLGVQRFSAGSVTVSGSGSTISSGGSVIVGQAGTGSLLISGGATVSSVGLTSTQSALSVGAAGFGVGTVTIQGAGSQFTAAGAAVIGGDNRGLGTSPGGTGSVSITAGGVLQTNAMTVAPGSSISIDGASQENVAGDLLVYGSVVSYGTLAVSGALAGSGALTLGGGFASIGSLSTARVAFTGTNTTLRVGALSGTSQVSGLQSGDRIDLVGNSAVGLSGTTVSTSGGSLVLSSGGPYTLVPDGAGGTFVVLGVDTIGVFRFFDSSYGTHFFSSSTAEKDSIINTRPDLVYEGVGLESVDPVASDPNASPVYRFFDTSYGTHFFTASASERDSVIASRPDLLYEGTGFIEHVVQQPGDVGVYRFFDTRYGTHFYTADPNERATIIATRSDLIDEGIGFYAPP